MMKVARKRLRETKEFRFPLLFVDDSGSAAGSCFTADSGSAAVFAEVFGSSAFPRPDRANIWEKSSISAWFSIVASSSSVIADYLHVVEWVHGVALVNLVVLFLLEENVVVVLVEERSDVENRQFLFVHC